MTRAETKKMLTTFFSQPFLGELGMQQAEDNMSWIKRNSVGRVYLFGETLYFELQKDKALYLLTWRE